MKVERGCWTCKRRKIGCDRGLPECNNCIRTKRECLGYGFRLAWPEQPDAERSTVTSAPSTREHAPITCYGKQFLNFSSEDVQFSRHLSCRRKLMQRLVAQPAHALSVHRAILGQDAMLLTYYEQVIAPMCSTTRARNGFRYEMLPIALASQDPSREALCNAMLAISAFHCLGSAAALPYKINTMRTLSTSLTFTLTHHSPETMEAQLATCMMLSMYSVFDEEEGQFNLHLGGAEKILRDLRSSQPSYLVSKFLINWFLYYDILGRFTQPSLTNHDDSDVVSLLEMVDLDASLIVGLLGCSIETFEIIHYINRLRILSLRDLTPLSAEAFQQRVALERRLQSLAQRLDPDEVNSSSAIERRRVEATAELYRLAALLYLQRVCPTYGDELRREQYLEQAFSTLGVLRVVTSPWPVFLVACESQNDEQRIQILEILDRMDSVRSIGNVHVMRKIIETVWKQHDLCCFRDRPGEMKWWYLVDSDVAAPWFA